MSKIRLDIEKLLIQYSIKKNNFIRSLQRYAAYKHYYGEG